MADALLRCESANARLRGALSVPSSDPDHDYLRYWVDQVGACDLDDLICDDALLDLPAPERASPALALHPFTPLIVPPSTEPFPPPRLQSASCYSQTFDSAQDLFISQCFKELQAWPDTLLNGKRGRTRFSLT
eukprot:6204567-Pleurochrysis_carterae.AAC.2